MWEEHDDMLVGKFDLEVLPEKLSVVAFDLDDTIITPDKSQEKVRPGAPYTKWKFCKNVTKKLASIPPENLILIISNQAKLNQYMAPYKKKIEEVVKGLRENNVTSPILLYAINGYNACRKPSTGVITSYFLPFIKDKNVKEITNFLYVGDAAGRSTDHSDSDRKFLMNVDLLFKSLKINIIPIFMEPEQYFQGSKAKPFTLSGLNPKKLLDDSRRSTGIKKISELDSSLTYLKPHNTQQEVIFMIGAPGSGKSNISRRIEKEWKYVRINQDELGSKKAVDNELTLELNNGNSIVLDATNGTSSRRSELVNIINDYFKDAKKPVHIRAFVMNGDLSQDMQRDLASHLNQVRERAGATRIPQIAYRVYYSKYIPPTEEEGFTQIQNVKFVPCFKKAIDVLNFMQLTA